MWKVTWNVTRWWCWECALNWLTSKAPHLYQQVITSGLLGLQLLKAWQHSTAVKGVTSWHKHRLDICWLMAIWKSTGLSFNTEIMRFKVLPVKKHQVINFLLVWVGVCLSIYIWNNYLSNYLYSDMYWVLLTRWQPCMTCNRDQWIKWISKANSSRVVLVCERTVHPPNGPGQCLCFMLFEY